jgi:hypothetical protein
LAVYKSEPNDDMLSWRILMRRSVMQLGILVSSFVAIVSSTPAGAQTPKILPGLRNVRYCELLIVKRQALKVEATVYNTLKLNDCPEQAWKAIDADAVKKQMSADFVEKNGPRNWVIDAMSYTGSTEQRTFDTLAMHKVAVADLPLTTLFTQKAQPYQETSIARNTIWMYRAGKPMFTLISPGGVIYAMQSYSQIVDPTLSYNDLATLGSRLHLPTGWRYTIFTPSTDVSLSSNGQAHVIQDNLQDTYQRM